MRALKRSYARPQIRHRAVPGFGHDDMSFAGDERAADAPTPYTATRATGH